MIHVTISRDCSGKYSGFLCSGHADYAEEGSDIVCAGVSAIVINTVNCLTDLLGEDLSVDADEENGGRLEVSFNRPPCEKAVFLIDCMIYGFDWIIEQYGSLYLRYSILN